MRKYKFQLKGYEYLKVDINGVIFNTKTNRIKKLCLNGYSKGIWVDGKKFLTNPKQYLELNTKHVAKNNFERQLLRYENKESM
ncbi:hypothetical protein AVT43_gp52 [Polaribacter phage P12002L]|uniref:Uncharacterized protein n=2 Tax=Incheonvirus TaxID=2976977 RepID=A0A0F7DD29_9CAUD|nr:hypothetical protein AVT42_gp50 [Polaribacter phage P12002S]YP_009209712.1 hypothetical protein AVT43_gp52 [Polaribacter phage P12002L]AKG94226.1 hypothetical protein P12002L_0052 [Polaribacter phage P12002L]AKG94306.1 hypothetical protein P12002S_0050 [Polaribacter phage P12002S]